jgi:hypothetical protein
MEAITAAVKGVVSKIFSPKQADVDQPIKIFNPYAKANQKRPSSQVSLVTPNSRKKPCLGLDTLERNLLRSEEQTATNQNTLESQGQRVSVVKQEKDNVSSQEPPYLLNSKPTQRFKLGHLRVREGVNFGWQGDILLAQTNEQLGRVYYSGFTLHNNLCAGSFRLGDAVQMETQYVPPSNYVIVAVFQATKSFLGYYNDQQQEIQKRGMCFLFRQMISAS